MLNHYHQPCCGERASAAKPLRQIQYALQTSRQRALPHSFRYFMGVLMTKLACHVCIQYILQLYIYINNYTYYHTYIYIYDAIQRWLWNHPRLVDAWGFSNEHLSISGAGESKSGRGESWWSGMEMRATHGLNWMVEPCWTNRNSGYPRISQDTRIYHSYYPLVN